MATGVYIGIVFISVDMLVKLVGLHYSSIVIVLKCRLPWYNFPSKPVCSFQLIFSQFYFFAHIETSQVPLQPSLCDMVVFL